MKGCSDKTCKHIVYVNGWSGLKFLMSKSNTAFLSLCFFVDCVYVMSSLKSFFIVYTQMSRRYLDYALSQVQ